jgi:hypothetical protein
MTAAQAGGVGDIDAPHDRDRGSGQGHRGVLEGVVTLSVVYGASIKQPGDVVAVHVLNREVDAVLAVVAQAQQFGPVSVSTAEVQSIIDEHAARVIDDDVDEVPCEKIERSLHRHGQLNRNFLVLMGLGAVIAVAELLSDPVPQAGHWPR